MKWSLYGEIGFLENKTEKLGVYGGYFLGVLNYEVGWGKIARTYGECNPQILIVHVKALSM